jgi:hypothetical protein
MQPFLPQGKHSNSRYDQLKAETGIKGWHGMLSQTKIRAG